MKIRDIIVEQQKPGLLRRAAGAIGRHVYSAATGKPYREPRKPTDPVAVQQPTQAQQTQPAAQTQQTARYYKTDVPYQTGYRTAVFLPTAAGDRRFWFDGQDWWEHTGLNWPKDLETSQKVSDPKIIQLIAQQVELKNTRQIPYGQRPKKYKKS